MVKQLTDAVRDAIMNAPQLPVRTVTGASVGLGERFKRTVTFYLSCGHQRAIVEPHEMPGEMGCFECFERRTENKSPNLGQSDSANPPR